MNILFLLFFHVKLLNVLFKYICKIISEIYHYSFLCHVEHTKIHSQKNQRTLEKK